MQRYRCDWNINTKKRFDWTFNFVQSLIKINVVERLLQRMYNNSAVRQHPCMHCGRTRHVVQAAANGDCRVHLSAMLRLLQRRDTLWSLRAPVCTTCSARPHCIQRCRRTAQQFRRTLIYFFLSRTSVCSVRRVVFSSPGACRSSAEDEWRVDRWWPHRSIR